jgi:hypothetical protein
VLLDTFGQPTGGVGLQIYITGANTIFLFTAIAAAYGMVGGRVRGGFDAASRSL